MKIYYWIGGIVFFVIIAAFFLLNKSTSPTQVHAEVQAGFLVHVPEEWIGSYATAYTEMGDVVFYFKAPEGSVPLFVIHKRSEEIPTESRFLGENNGFVYGVTETEKDIYSGEKESEFREIQKSVPSVISSFTLL